MSAYESQKDRNHCRVEGTCRWVLDHPHYQDWLKSTHDNLLWISADPGCGKSVLSRALVDQEFKGLGSISICYFFFKDNDEQNVLSTALCALLHQLFNYHPDLLHHAISPWDRDGKKLQNETAELWRILLTSATDAAADNVICILDALDECGDEGRSTLISLLNDFHNSSMRNPSRNSTLKFLVTSRPYDHIERPFHKATTKFPTIRLAGEEENEQIAKEIDLVVGAWISEISSEVHLQPDVQEMLKIRLKQIQNRTYLWLYLVFQELRKSLKRTVKSFTRIIEEIPESVDEAYENILEKSDNQQEARTLLSIIVAAVRPLTLKEMDIALNIALTDQRISCYGELDLDKDNIRNRIRNLCGLFVYISDSKILLFHQTAKEFLVRSQVGSDDVSGPWKQSLNERNCESIMAITCMRYLLFQDFDKRPIDFTLNDFRDVWVIGSMGESLDDFLDYSAKRWHEHFRKANIDEKSTGFSLSLTLLSKIIFHVTSPGLEFYQQKWAG